MTACSAQPTTYAQATSGYKLADVTMASGNYTIADGSTSGRKITMASMSGVSVDTSGTATHVALCTGSALIYVTTCTSQVLTAGNTMTFGSWSVEIGDPS